MNNLSKYGHKQFSHMVKVLGFFQVVPQFHSFSFTEENLPETTPVSSFCTLGSARNHMLVCFTVPNNPSFCGKTPLVDIQVHGLYSPFTSYY